MGWRTISKVYLNGTLNLGSDVVSISFNKTTTSAWIIEQGQYPTNVIDSFIFYHRETSPTTKASRWWFNGAQTNMSSEMSFEINKREINDIQTPLNRIMELKPKE